VGALTPICGASGVIISSASLADSYWFMWKAEFGPLCVTAAE